MMQENGDAITKKEHRRMNRQESMTARTGVYQNSIIVNVNRYRGSRML